MRTLTPRLFLVVLASWSALFPVGLAHHADTPPQATAPAADPIVGAWKLDLAKSTNATAEAELLTIVPQGDGFKLTFLAAQSNKYNPHYEVVTDMKGSVSAPTDSGKPMNGTWRFTRDKPNAFVVEGEGSFGGWKKEYTVSADRQTLSVHELPGNSVITRGKVDSNGAFHPVRETLVFDRISESEAQNLTREMVDSDAAQKKLAAEKAAEQAALDAVACSLAPGETGVSDSVTNQNAWHEYICAKDRFAIRLPDAPKKQGLEQSNFYELFVTQDESIVAELSVSSTHVDCKKWVSEMQAIVNRPLPPGAIRILKETTFQGRPGFESVDPHTNGPTYVLDDLTQCSEGTTYEFHSRWLKDHPKPEEVTRIFDSFRRLPKENNQ
jgi:hypothetical protein